MHQASHQARWNLYGLLTLIVALWVIQGPARAQSGEWTELVDRNLARWEGDSRFWSIRDGAIVGRSSAKVPCDQTTYLVRKDLEVEDFELIAEYRIVGGNSGIQFRSRALPAHQVAGPQADIEDGASWSGCLYEQDGRGVMTTRGLRVVHSASGANERRFAQADDLLAAVRSQDWNTYRIVAVGGTIVLEINGTRMSETVDEAPARHVRGALALQLHAGPAMEVAYRSIKVRKLTSADAPQLTELAPALVKPRLAPGPLPSWMWTQASPLHDEQVAFVRSFALPFEPVRARLLASADNHVAVWLNQARVLVHDEWSALGAVDVTAHVRSGANTLTMLAKNDGGPAGAWCELLIEGAEGKRLRLISDGSFTAQRLAKDADWKRAEPQELDPARFSPVHIYGQMGVAPWGMMDDPDGATSDASTPAALEAQDMQLQPGWAIELLHQPDPNSQGSWVALCEAPGAVLYAADQYGAVWRASMRARPMEFARIPATIGGAHGLVWYDDALYCVVAESSSARTGLWRVDDSDGDSIPDAPRLLRAFEGGGEHGPHGLVVGPDDQLWIVGGNHTTLPECAQSRVPLLWSEDNLTPIIEDPRGHANGIRAPGGWIVKTDKLGERFELVSMGYRNAYDLAFDTRGELYTWDSDMEWDVGAPWYRPVRIAQAVSGSDFGWRTGSSKWPTSWLDTLPSTADLGRGSPTGLVFGTGLRAPARWQRALYACDWSFGTIWALDLKDDGAASTATAVPFLRGTPFPATDILVGSDGALWISSGGRRTRSGLYRVSWTDAASSVPAEPLALSAALLERRALERLHAPNQTWTADDEARVAAALASSDRWLAYAARVALEHAGIESFDALVARGCTEPELILAGLRRWPNERRTWIMAQLNTLPSTTVEARREWLRLAHVACVRLAPLQADESSALQARAQAMGWCGDERADWDRASLLGHFGGAAAIEALLGRLETSRKQEDQLHLAYVLSGMASPIDLDQRRRFLTRWRDLLPLMRGGESLQLYAERMRDRFVASIPADQLAHLADAVSKPVDSPAAPTAATASFVRAWTRAEVRELLSQRGTPSTAAAGQAAFAGATCSACHRIDGAGGSSGPDLTTLGSRFGVDDLLDALFEPSKTISDQYADTELQTDEGDLYVGRVESDRDGIVRLVDSAGRKLEVESARIVVRRPWKLSRMPVGLLDTLDEAGIRALFDYSLGKVR